MHPAFSVIFFTTLSGAGFGLWTWLGLRIALGAPPQDFQGLGWILLLACAAIAAAVGLLASFWHLGKPLRSWRAFSQWRTSWLSREGVLAVASFVPAAALSVLLRDADPTGIPTAARVAAGLLALLSIATIGCTAMIYASLKPIPAWRHPLVPPGYLLFALLTGGVPMLLSTWPGAAGLDGVLPWLLVAIALLLLALKLAYWRGIDRDPLPQSRGDAIGLPART
ncbi:MAG: dimethyl sulfoxide reductase anchor subunit, partial [Lysobacteraceae bacterium]